MKPDLHNSYSVNGVSYRIGNFIPQPDHFSSFTRIINSVCDKYALTREQLLSPYGKRDGKRDVVWPKFELMARLRTVRVAGLPASLPKIGQLLGGMDHSSVWNGIQRYEEIMEFKRLNGISMETVFMLSKQQYADFKKFRKAKASAKHYPSSRAA